VKGNWRNYFRKVATQRAAPVKLATMAQQACAIALGVGCVLALMTSDARAQEPSPPGASSCLGCHSRPGAAIPALRGRDPAEVAATLRAFREGTRPATLMSRLAKGFSESESQAIAAWVVK
jgi:cytochrome c553